MTKTRMISFDIGKNNLAYADFLVSSAAISSIEFDLKNISFQGVSPVSRCMALRALLQELLPDENTIIVIERQVPTNIVAMEIMYGLITASLQFSENVIIFDPKLKFTTFNINYTTKNKTHKKKSVSFVQDFLKKYSEKLVKFNSFPKKDDISDAIFQGLAQLYIMNFISDLSE
jgi:hypothetical protein